MPQSQSFPKHVRIYLDTETHAVLKQFADTQCQGSMSEASRYLLSVLLRYESVDEFLTTSEEQLTNAIHQSNQKQTETLQEELVRLRYQNKVNAMIQEQLLKWLFADRTADIEAILKEAHRQASLDVASVNIKRG